MKAFSLSRLLLTTAVGLGLAMLLPGCEVLQGLANLQGGDQVVAGLKEALRVGTDRTVSLTSREGGYNRNPLIRILLPEKLRDLGTTLRRVGLGAQIDDFENRMNLAAEQAAKEAGGVFLDAIGRMSFADAKAILAGSDTAATDYFRQQTAAELRRRYQPIINAQMQKVGAVSLYQDLLGKYNRIPLVPKVDFAVEDYVADQALKGLFSVLGEEEKKIRRDPAARTTELLRQVFGNR